MLRSLLKRLIPLFWRTRINSLLRAHNFYRPYLFGGGKAGPPHSVDIEITFRCNARCPMCPLHGDDATSAALNQQAKQQQEFTTEQWCALMNQLATMGVKRVLFTGGEPFLRPDLLDLIRYAISKNLSVGCITNGVNLSAAKAQELVNSGIETMHFSVDGPGKLHDQMRGVPNLFSRIEETILAISKEKEKLGASTPHLTIGATLSTLNQGKMAELAAATKSWPATLVLGRLFYTTPQMEAATQLKYPMGSTKGEDQTIPIIHRNVDVDIVAADIKAAEQESKSGLFPLISNLAGRDDIQRRYYEDSYTDHNKCFYPWQSARIDPFGAVYPCSMNITMGQLSEDSFGDIWNGESYKKFRQTLKKEQLFPSCSKCCVLSKDNLYWRWLPRFWSW